MSDSQREGFTNLNPDRVIDAVESQGFLSDLRVFALNSYENRVYQFGLEEAEPVVVKFYRPARWSNEQILEEHRFTQQLFDTEIPVIPPWQNDDGDTLFHFEGYRFAVYPRRGGHAPALDDMDNLFQLGRLFGRLHLMSSSEDFVHRPTLDANSFGHQSRQYLLENDFLPDSLKEAYSGLSRDVLALVDQRFDQSPARQLRAHGDGHVGNILWRGEETWLVDFDDSRTAPAIQDLWMFLSGDGDAQQRALLELVEGYEEFFEFNPRELTLIEPLRSLRIMHHAAWLAKRWQDPAFPKAFPWFNTERYWGEHILQLREQLSALQEPPLRLPF
ncbi:putative homoserine kinase type II (protein kinase fold) [Spongiibacter sp. IMCC21906]|jgi:Ser/Thr protein kinase RdoA (MazF antagonist)|uniref:serine/threonine protein kinase n=1 Tax=Spongiibacter sp. IMCC21906 TaxID=1620392 RepID=UPI00062DFAE2|nr:serine/threonine protein kinase [Spongiibacter sp. IMCC21906]AKH70471.1 putative homoserine kinase type II (protein kinase fold) [Spongiibacter sp. IMCC21906]